MKVPEFNKILKEAYLLGKFDIIHTYNHNFLRFHGKEVKDQLWYEWAMVKKEKGL